MDQETVQRLEDLREEFVTAKDEHALAGAVIMATDPAIAASQRKRLDDAYVAVKKAEYKRRIFLDRIAEQQAIEEMEQETGTIA
jgi:hypothetical protein